MHFSVTVPNGFVSHVIFTQGHMDLMFSKIWANVCDLMFYYRDVGFTIQKIPKYGGSSHKQNP